MLHGHFSFWTLMDSDRVFTHFFLYSYYAFCYGITIALILAVLRDSYRTTKGQMFFKATMDMQDYEMVEFMMKRFKLWAGIDKPKQVSISINMLFFFLTANCDNLNILIGKLNRDQELNYLVLLAVCRQYIRSKQKNKKEKENPLAFLCFSKEVIWAQTKVFFTS